MNRPLLIQDFLEEAKNSPIIDVRSPAEFRQGHIPGAFNMPLFSDEERAKIGTTYVQIGREEAVKIGYEVANPKIGWFLSEVKKISGNKGENVLVHCWRGGMRSGKFAHLLNEHGYTTATLVKGYKAYRNSVLESFGKKVNLIILGGETGSGKTEILKNLKAKGEQVVDLEAIAHHKGSAFGALGEQPQPTYEHFENELSSAFSKLDLSKRIWLEDEARNIGRTQIPVALWEQMKIAPVIAITIPKEERLQRLLHDYGNFPKEDLKASILKIGQRLGPQHTKQALEELETGNLREVADITLSYYDKSYHYNHQVREMKNIFSVSSISANANANAEKVLEFANKNFKNA